MENRAKPCKHCKHEYLLPCDGLDEHCANKVQTDATHAKAAAKAEAEAKS